MKHESKAGEGGQDEVTRAESETSAASKGEVNAEEAAVLRENIAQTRAEMSGTIEELHGKLNPTVLKDQALDQFREVKETIRAEVKAEIAEAKAKVKEELIEAKAALRGATIGKVETMVQNAQDTVKDTGRSIVATIRANPVPAALAGIGLAWLLMNRQGARSGGRRMVRGSRNGGLAHEQIRVSGYDEQGASHDGQGALSGAMGQVGDKASDVAHAIQRKAAETAHQAGELVHDAQGSISAATREAGQAVEQFAHETQARARRIERRVSQAYRENPLAIAAAVLAAGTAVGLMIPATHREDAIMGGARDQVVGKAQEVAQGALGKVEEVATQMTGEATKALHEKRT